MQSFAGTVAYIAIKNRPSSVAHTDLGVNLGGWGEAYRNILFCWLGICPLGNLIHLCSLLCGQNTLSL